METVSRSGENPNALRPWLAHYELGQAANVWMGMLLFRMRRKPEALDRFDEVLAPRRSLLTGIFERHPTQLIRGSRLGCRCRPAAARSARVAQNCARVLRRTPDPRPLAAVLDQLRR